MSWSTFYTVLACRDAYGFSDTRKALWIWSGVYFGGVGEKNILLKEIWWKKLHFCFYFIEMIYVVQQRQRAISNIVWSSTFSEPFTKYKSNLNMQPYDSSKSYLKQHWTEYGSWIWFQFNGVSITLSKVGEWY